MHIQNLITYTKAISSVIVEETQALTENMSSVQLGSAGFKPRQREVL